MHQAKPVSGIGHEWPIGSLTHQLTDRLTQRETMTGGMHPCYLQSIIFYLKCRSWHERIMSVSMMRHADRIVDAAVLELATNC
jgi:hypothetical protein